MKRYRKIIGLLTVVFMLSVMIAGCGGGGGKANTNEPAKGNEESANPGQTGGNSGSGTLEPVKLTMYLLGDKAPDFDLVYEEVNKKLQKDINATIEVKFLGWGEYEQKYPLIFASGENFDIIYSADWAFYNSQATKGGFYEITKDALEKHAPQTAKTMYPDAWEQAKVDGKVYMLPQNNKELTGYVYMVRGDLMKKFGMTEIKDINDFEKYLDNVAKTEKNLIPIDVGSDFDMLFMFDRLFTQATTGKIDGIGPWQTMGWTPKDDASVTIKPIPENEHYLEVVTKLKDWKDRGFWSKSAIVNKTTNKESFANGRSAAAMMNLNDAKGQYAKLIGEHPDWDIQVFDAQGNVPAVLNSYLANGMSIYANSKNPERALMALDLFRNDESYHDLIAYGIKGKHYDLNADKEIVPLPDSSKYPYDGNCNWGLRNDKLWKEISGGIPTYKEIYKKWTDNALMGKFATFNFNDASVKNEVAAINDVFKTDYKLLGLGFAKDPATDIERMLKKLKAAGIDKVYAEMQKQAQEYLKNKQ